MAAEFGMSLNGIGPIAMETRVEIVGKNAVLTASARNTSGVSIQSARWCVHARGIIGCAFNLWTTAEWRDGVTLRWKLPRKIAGGLPEHSVKLVLLDLSAEAQETFKNNARLTEDARSTGIQRGLEEKQKADEARREKNRLEAQAQADVARRRLAEQLKEAEVGNIGAQKWLAYAYANGEGAPNDPLSAARWYRKAAELDDPWAEYGLATLYALGRGVAQSNVAASALYENAATQGYAPAQYMMAYLFFNGTGVPQDYSRAHMWANLAASVGVKDAVLLRDAIAVRLAPDQLAAAQKAATAWEPRRNDNQISNVPASVHAQSSGSGFGISHDGYIITNHHVVDGCRTIQIAEGGQRMTVSLTATDPGNDLALVKSERIFETPARIRGKAARLGEPVWAAGFPYSDVLHAFNVTPGAVSAEYVKQLQITAPIQPGNSGGPLFGKEGAVVGIVVARLGETFTLKTGSIAQNVNFAIKASVLKEFLDSKYISYISDSVNDPTLDPTVLAEEARKFTVLLECWN